MRVFFLFLGLALGVNLGYCLDPASFLVAIFLSLFALFFSFKQKEALAFSIALAVGIALGLIRGPSSEGQCQLTGMVVRSSDNYFVVVSGFSRYYVGIKDHGYEIGDFLKLEGYVKPFVRTTYEAQFDFGAYLKSYGVTQEISYPKIENVFLNPLRFRTYELQFLSHFDENAASLLDSLLFNRKDYSSMPILLASSLNVMNLLSASGIFFSFLMRQVDKTTHRLIRKEKTGKLVSLGVSLFALPLALRKIGILRVILTRIVAYWNEYHYRGALKGFEVASLSGVIMIFLSRYAVFQSGFLLGFGSSLTLSFAQPLLRRVKGRRMPKLAGLLLLRLFFLPAAISFGGVYHVFGFAFSLLLIPPTYFFAAIGLFSYLSFPYPTLINPLGEAFTGILSFLKSFDVVVYLPDDGIWAIFLYYCVFFVALLALELGFKGAAKGMVLGTLSLYLVSLLPILSWFEQSVTFINVGQGDSILIQDRDTIVMIDTGGNVGFDMASETLIPYLRKRRIYHVDCLIASHHDYDHIGAADSLQANFEVKRFVDGDEGFPLTVGGMTFNNLNVWGGTEENETSLVLRLDFMDKTWLFMGDAPVEVEKKIAKNNPKIECDVLKVGHHGSNTSTSAALLSWATPEEAVISVGAKNSYGHPSQDVLDRLSSYRVKTRRTDEEGTIVYSRWVSPWL